MDSDSECIPRHVTGVRIGRQGGSRRVITCQHQDCVGSRSRSAITTPVRGAKHTTIGKEHSPIRASLRPRPGTDARFVARYIGKQLSSSAVLKK